ncbi:hypothetical protein J6590_091220 [Homalodisca vitripennis]|nr:hypothetical protein J6590_091220 [Homalodisca vitripennis]
MESHSDFTQENQLPEFKDLMSEILKRLSTNKEEDIVDFLISVDTSEDYMALAVKCK